MISFNKNKVVVPAVLILGIFIGGVVVLRTQGIGAQILSEGKKIFVPVASDSEADPDNDGLKNWEEKIHKTDARNPDTDGDGYLDGEETASGYDPTIPAPGDALAGTDANQPRPLPKNLTDQLAQTMAQKVLSGEITPTQGDKLNLDDPNSPYNQEIMQEALYQVGQTAEKYFIAPQIPDSEIIISQALATKDALYLYLEQSGKAMSYERSKQLNQSELAIIKDAIDANNTKNIEALLGDYQDTIKNLKTISVPSGIADLHKRQIAIFQLDANILESVKNFQNDPVKAMAAMEAYPKALEMLQKWQEDFMAELESY